MCNFWVTFWQTHFVAKGNKGSTNEIYVTVTNSLSMNPNSTIQKWFILAINTFITSFSSFDVWFGIPKHFSSQHDNPSSLSFKNSVFFYCNLNFVSKTKKDIQFNTFFIPSLSQMKWSWCLRWCGCNFSHYLSNCNL